MHTNADHIGRHSRFVSFKAEGRNTYIAGRLPGQDVVERCLGPAKIYSVVVGASMLSSPGKPQVGELKSE